MTNPNHTDTSRIADLRFQVSEKMPINHSDLSCLFDRIEALEAENERLVASNEQWQVDYNEVVLEKLELLAVLREMTPDYEMLVDQSWDDGAIWSWVEKAKGIAAKARAALGEKQ